jgi:hypothetical protein
VAKSAQKIKKKYLYTRFLQNLFVVFFLSISLKVMGVACPLPLLQKMEVKKQRDQ